jgi:FixJ family two-component response regulator
LTRPVGDQDLLEAIPLAIVQDRARRDDERAVAERAYPVGTLTPRERSAQRRRQTKPPVEELG